MTLLSLCVKQGISVVVSHVNYKKRDSADRDEHIVLDFCKKHGIICEVCCPTYEEGNFQGWAREVRYAFYKQLCEKHHCDGVLLAHHQDDVLETYLMQMERGSQVDCYTGVVMLGKNISVLCSRRSGNTQGRAQALR